LSELFTDADPEWLAFQLNKNNQDLQDMIDKVVELKGSYPKRQSGGNKRKYEEEVEVSASRKPKLVLKRDYTQKDSLIRSQSYYENCQNYLFFEAYAFLPQYQLKSWFALNNRQLVPTCIHIETMLKSPETLPCKLKKALSKNKGKRKGDVCQEFGDELKAWKELKSKCSSFHQLRLIGL
jgi:hypothetical protein